MSAKEDDTTPTYWRSLTELTNEASHQKDPELRGKEFPTEPSRVIDPLHRRNFFQLMGASMALAGLTAGYGLATTLAGALTPAASIIAAVAVLTACRTGSRSRRA